MLALPWAIKFLWAPLIDTLQSSRWNLRSWIIASQLVMGIALLPLLFFDLTSNFSWLLWILLLHACAAATQDVSIDALCIAEVPENERSMMNGWMQAGMLVARAAFGGIAILFLNTVGMEIVIASLIGLIWGTLILITFTQQSSVSENVSFSKRFRNFTLIIRKFAHHKLLWYGMLFAILGGTAYESVGAVAGPFLVDHGFSKEVIGTFFSIFSPVGMLIGALAGGYAVRKREIHNALIVTILCIVGIVYFIASYDALHDLQADRTFLVALSLLYLGIGVFTALSYTLLMNITDPNLAATQFSTYMGGTNICESLSALFVGMLIAKHGYPFAFGVMGTISLAGIFIVKKLKT